MTRWETRYGTLTMAGERGTVSCGNADCTDHYVIRIQGVVVSGSHDERYAREYAERLADSWSDREVVR